MIKQETKTAYIGLGSNVGNKINHLKRTVEIINTENNIVVKKISSVYITSPYGLMDQDNFLNCAVEIESSYTPLELMTFLKKTESAVGRQIREKWGPREIDIDLLLYSDYIINTGGLTIPHPEILKRDFVIVPLLELKEDLVHPINKNLLKEYLDQSLENHILEKLNIILL
ncbi:MAG: 2-amino-4-hydroxy-6-hydroxymethyldihydropteridine diphosphokinase [Melioribacteraceae bacterium]|nr:2-amino-4-hydroxy-6-hydroxymethyldihydropteridine diphosphokinase [Melioribacteraceae bacterium]